MNFLMADDIDEDSNNLTSLMKVKAEDLFMKIMSHHKQFIRDCNATKTFKVNPQHPSLLPKLRPYQRNAVLWMLRQETELEKPEEADSETHILWERVTLKDGSLAYYNETGGHLVRERPRCIANPPGGILADEMGLGKTVEILSLMLCHPRSDMQQPEWREPIVTHQKESRKRRRKRTPSPTEWQVYKAEVKTGELISLSIGRIKKDGPPLYMSV